jgi:hypothetical protein
VKSLPRFALTLAAVGVLVAIVRTCLRPAARPESQPQQAICAPAVSRRVALVVVDALRADTFFGDAFASFRAAHPAAASGVVRTSPVSMSTAGVRSMATGTFPDLFDVLHNWDNVKSGVPAVPALARAAGRKTAIFGDSIWRELFPDDFVIADTEARIPRIIYYLRAETLVDDTFVGHLADRLQQESPPDFLVLHLVGLDHAGHRHGVTSPKYADVARRVAAHIERVAGLLPAGTTVLLTSDHGATDSGGHGGGSEAETTAPLFAFGAGVAPGARLSINQIDLAPTLSCLLGLPFPATSLGRPAVELFDESAPAHLARLRAGLSQVEHAWAGPTDAPESRGIRATSDDDERRALDARFATLFEAFAHNVARTRLPVALWGLVLLVFLVTQMGDLSMSRPRSVATASLMAAGIILTGFSSNWSLLGLVVCLAVTLLFCAVAEARRSRFATPAHLIWAVSAAGAVLLALARDYQGRSTTLLFGSPSDAKLALGGAALCVVLRALDRRLRASADDRSSSLMLPIIFIAVIEGGDPAIAIGNGFFAAWLAWDAVEGGRARAAGQSLRVIGALAQGALLALYLSPPWFKGWVHADVRSTIVGSVAALAALWFMRPRTTARRQWLPFVVLPAFVFTIAQLRGGRLGETAVEIGLAASLAGLGVFAAIAWRRGDAPIAKWGMACALLALWWLLCAPPQRIVFGLGAVGLIAFVRALRPVGPLAVTPALVGLALAFWRWGLIAHFEGEFGFGALEISLAYVGNPGRHAPQAALTILLKAWMPLAVTMALLANEKASRYARAVSQAIAFALGARIVHLAVATAFNPGSFYTIHRILGELTHQIFLLLGIGVFSFVRAPERVGAPARGFELSAAQSPMAE